MRPVSPGTARMPLVSIGTPARRWLTIVTSATASAPASGSASPSSGNVGAEADVRTVLGEQQRRVGRQRVERVRDGRQRVVVDDDALGGVDGLRAGLGHDGGDDVADESHLVGREHGPVQRLGHHRELLQRRETEVVATGVVHGDDARHRRRLADVDRDQVGVRDRSTARTPRAPCSARRGRRRTSRSPVKQRRDPRDDGPRSRGSNRMQPCATPDVKTRGHDTQVAASCPAACS